MKVTINNRDFDSHICKYFAIDTNFYNSLLNNYLWFSNPSDFNDPYDLNLNLVLPKYTIEDITFLASLIKERGFANGKSQYEIINHFKSNPTSIKDALQSYANTIASTIGIACFSQNESSLLMWSHYGDRHKGVCLKFDMCKDESFFNIPVKADYPREYPIFDYLELRKKIDDLAQFLVGTKSIDWKYENEIRIVKTKQNCEKFRGEISFNKTCLIEAIFGYKTDPQIIDNLKTLIQLLGYSCKFSKLTLKKDDFGLTKEIIE